MRLRPQQCCLTVAVAISCTCTAYETDTHADMTNAAAHASVLASLDKLKRMSLLGVNLEDESQKFPTSEGVSSTVMGLLEFGARFEDDRSVIQVFRHFFNPVTGQGMQYGPVSGVPSPDWALEDTGEFGEDGNTQPYSYRKARNYFFGALTLSNPDDRRKNWGLTFQSLGQVVHHQQDMAQPQHARND